ncbi:hypothetical protein [Serratia plymuthica]|uniref:hypothetical protein n=1 Tax=Serratia plymuthica TaxID=82996 RepID=UPI0021B7E776|nr:hypothetical protein [Serratia plymuthica]
MQTISSMLQLCATVLNQADERSVSFIDFLTSATGTILAGFSAIEAAVGCLSSLSPAIQGVSAGLLEVQLDLGVNGATVKTVKCDAG